MVAVLRVVLPCCELVEVGPTLLVVVVGFPELPCPTVVVVEGAPTALVVVGLVAVWPTSLVVEAVPTALEVVVVGMVLGLLSVMACLVGFWG